MKCFKASCRRWLALGASLLVAACAAPAPRGDAAADWRATWDASVAGLERLRLQGQIQVQWKDADGSHREQGDLDAILDGDARSSLRVTKFGDVMMWIGVTPDQAWVFDMTSDPTTLTVGVPGAAEGQPMLPPSVLRLVLALDPWPSGTIRTVDDSGNVVLEGQVSGGSFRARLDAGTLRPIDVRFHRDDVGTVTGTHRWTTGEVRIAPRVRVLARVVDVSAGDTLLKFRTSRGQVLSADDIARLAGVWFDVDRIAAHLKPELIQ
ncbi:MAG: hypothetical protein QF733_08110 [Phycisphaerales bacterium]|nr:hypothetical protein [Phycisphaerales bacterium]